MAKLTCDGCTVCCKNESIFLKPKQGDNVDDYLVVTMTNPVTGKAELAIPRNEEGHCHYLDEGVGCKIYEKRPLVCRNLDCRTWLDPRVRHKMEQIQKWSGLQPLTDEQNEAAQAAVKRCGPIRGRKPKARRPKLKGVIPGRRRRKRR